MSTLTVEINSFSYKNGYPKDPSGNGGGFAFDCRGIQNPGRIDEYKTQSGLDEGVQKYLHQETEMHTFLAYIFKTLEISIDEYLRREFTHLQINYGCTGGQHRSVYAAEQTASFIAQKYPQILVQVHHTNRENWQK